MHCKACDKTIEWKAIDPLLELCNKCYGKSFQSLNELLENKKGEDDNQS